MRILGIDPGLRTSGFGLVDANGSDLTYVASGTISTTHLDKGQLICNFGQGLRHLHPLKSVVNSGHQRFYAASCFS